MLTSNKILYGGVDIEYLFNKPHIQDLLSLTKAIMSVSDDISWLSFLRSRFCGIALSDLEYIYNYNRNNVIWQNLKQYKKIKGISKNSYLKIASVLPIINISLKKYNRISLSKNVLKTWIRLNAYSYYFKIDEIKDIDSFFYILIKCEKENFFLSAQMLDNKIKSDFVSQHHISNSIKIMTIYKSKGLEFDNIIIPYSNKMIKKDTNKLVNFFDLFIKKEYFFLFALQNQKNNNYKNLYKYINTKNNLIRYHELIRLWYVSLTRSKKRIYIIGSLGIKKNHISLNKKSFLYLFLLSMKKYIMMPNQNIQISNCSSNKINKIDKNDIKKNVDFLIKKNYLYENVFYYLCSRTIRNYVKVHLQQKKILVKCICYLVNSCNFNQVSTEKNIIYTYLKKKLSFIGVSKKELYLSIKYIKKILHQTTKSNLVKWIFQKYRNINENYFTLVIIKNKLYRFVIDKTFQTKNCLFIINYQLFLSHKIKFLSKLSEVRQYNLLNFYRYKFILLEKRGINIRKPILRVIFFFIMQDILYEL